MWHLPNLTCRDDLNFLSIAANLLPTDLMTMIMMIMIITKITKTIMIMIIMTMIMIIVMMMMMMMIMMIMMIIMINIMTIMIMNDDNNHTSKIKTSQDIATTPWHWQRTTQ